MRASFSKRRLLQRVAVLLLPAAILLPAFQLTTAVPSLAGPVVDVTAAAGRGEVSVAECAIAFDPARGRVYLGGHNDGGPDDRSMHFFRSDDQGLTWSLKRLGPEYDNLTLSRGDPSLVVDDAGWLYYVYACVSQGKPFAIACARSRDGGDSFDPPVLVFREDGFSATDKPYLTLGRDRNGTPLLLVTWSRMEGPGPPGIYIAVSRDRGQSFEAPVLVHAANATSYGMAATGPDGEIYVSFLAPGEWNYEVFIARSDDGGSTFTSVLLATTGMGFRHFLPAAPHRGVGAVPSLAVDNSDTFPGRVYVAWVSAGDEDRHDTDVLIRWADPAAALSAMRWSEPVPVHRNDPGSNFHGWLTVDRSDGTLAVISHATRRDPERFRVETWLAMSRDGGSTWAEMEISGHSSDARGVYGGVSPPDYLEYIGVVLDDGIAWCAWAGSTATSDPNLLHYLFRAVGPEEFMAARTIEVPGQVSTLAEAMAGARAGDRVRLAPGSTHRSPGELVGHVILETGDGPPAILDAAGDSTALRLSGSGAGATLKNVRVTGYTGTGVHLSRKPPPGGPSAPAPSDIHVPVRLQNVVLEGGKRGLVSDGTAVQVEGCRLTGQSETGLVLSFSEPGAARSSEVRLSVLAAGSEDASSIGLDLAGPEVTEAPRIERNTIHGFRIGLRLRRDSHEPSLGLFRPLLSGNLVTDYRQSALEADQIAGPVDVAAACNNFWSSHAEVMAVHGLPGSGGEEPGWLSVDPLYCGEASGELELRIDSPVSGGNSACGPVGALDVACVPEILGRDSRLASGSRLELRNEIHVPAGRRLVLEEGATLVNAIPHAAAALISASGGIIQVSATADSPVVIEAGPAEVAIQADGAASHLEIAGLELRGGRTGIRLHSGSGRITGSRLLLQDSVSLHAEDEATRLEISDVDGEGTGGIGLLLEGAGGGVTVESSRFSGYGVAARITGPGREDRSTGTSTPCANGPRFRDTEFRENDRAILLEPGASGADLGIGAPGRNLFLRQRGFAVVNESDCRPLEASGNRFGPGDITTAESPSGSVVWPGWLVDATGAAETGVRIVAMPNPSRGPIHLQVEFDDMPSRVSLEIVDLSGRLCRRLYDARPPGTRFALDWDGCEDDGKRAPAGIYWVVARDVTGRRSVLRIAMIW